VRKRDEPFWWGLPDRTPLITTAAEYRGQPAVSVSATQLGSEYSRSQATKIVTEWVEFFSAGPSAIEELEFVTRTPRRLFEALRGQAQLRRLKVKWGDYQDLSALAPLTGLETLHLSGASSVESMEPLRALANVEELSLEGLRHVHDLSPLAGMTSLTRLELGGDWMSPRIAHVDSIAFLRSMPRLRRLLLHTMIVDDLDYAPILDLPALEWVRVMKARGMRPTIDELRASTPWKE
jgi:hypothetical protein